MINSSIPLSFLSLSNSIFRLALQVFSSFLIHFVYVHGFLVHLKDVQVFQTAIARPVCMNQRKATELNGKKLQEIQEWRKDLQNIYQCTKTKTPERYMRSQDEDAIPVNSKQTSKPKLIACKMF